MPATLPIRLSGQRQRFEVAQRGCSISVVQYRVENASMTVRKTGTMADTAASPSSSRPIFGVHTGPANSTVDELKSLWQRIEEMPFDWISIWDHFYAATGQSTNCLDGIVAHTALAMSTERVQVGSLVYCAAYRHPGVLANAMAAIDQFSGGRCNFGIGAGWLIDEYDAYGFHFPRAADRLDRMEESLECVAGLLTGEPFSFEGKYYSLFEAVCDPAPLQRKLPLWVGGGGERRTLRIAAKYADGWNVPFIAADEFGRKVNVLHDHCSKIGRDSSEIIKSVNVGIATGDDSLNAQFGDIAEFVRPGVLIGSPNEIVEQIGSYVDAGAQQINIALRAPYDVSLLEHVSAAIDQF